MSETICLQRLAFTEKISRFPLYFRYRARSSNEILDPEVAQTTMRIPPQTLMSFNSLFNHFPEIYWQHWTRVKSLSFQVQLSGSGTLRLWRTPYSIDAILEADNPKEGGDKGGLAKSVLLASRHFDNPAGPVAVEIPDSAGGWRSWGALHAEILSDSGWVEAREGGWFAEVSANPVRLAIGFTTFDRPADVLANTRLLLENEAARAFIERVFIIDQGTKRVREHPDFAPVMARHGSAIELIEQGNYGGAGGFTRAIMEAQKHGGATHMLLMDDDAELEPEAVRRSVLFHATSRSPLAIGGQMLNAYRPLELVEAGGLYNRRSIRIEPAAWRRIEANSTGITFVDYNAWWFFTFPLHTVRDIGLPLPLFIRGDDIEFGLRLKAHRIQTVTLPGIAVWHEPFYCKEGGWTGYYDLRNLLILAMLHGRSGRLVPSLMLVQWVLGRLMRLDYYSAWLFEQAAREFLEGPDAIVANAPATRQRVAAAAKRLRGKQVPRGEEIHPRASRRPAARSMFGWGIRISRFLIRNLIRPSPSTEAMARYSMPADAPWWDIARHDVLVLDDPNQMYLEVRRRDRRSFLTIGKAALGHAARLFLSYPKLRERYRDAASQWSAEGFWWNYLQVERAGDPASPNAGLEATTPTGARTEEGAQHVSQ